VYAVDEGPGMTNSPMLPREVTALEFREGDTPVKYMLTLPQDATPGNVLRVKLGGRDFSILLPDYLDRGEKIIVIAPASPPPQYSKAAVVIEPSSPSSPPQREYSTPPPREIRAIEFRDGDVPSRYPYTIPSDAYPGLLTPITLAGRDFTIKIPDYVRPGEAVIVVAPASLI
jgi:hypothetical protein